MKMLISPAPLTRQAPHSAGIYHAVSLSNGRWFNNNLIVGNKVNGNEIKVIAEDEVKPFLNVGHRSLPCLLVSPNSPSPVCEDIKDVPVVQKSGHVVFGSSAVAHSVTAQQKNDRKTIEVVSGKQQALERRAQLCLKRLKTLRSSASKKALYTDVKNGVVSVSRKSKLDSHSDPPVHQDTPRNDCKQSASISYPSADSVCNDVDLPTSDFLAQQLYDAKHFLADIAAEEATDDEEDEAFFNYKDAFSLTESTRVGPVALSASLVDVLQKTPAWRYEQERLSLAARDAYLRLQIAELDFKIRQLSERAQSVFSKPLHTSSQSDTSITHACSLASAARTRPYVGSRKRSFYKISPESVSLRGNGCSPAIRQFAGRASGPQTNVISSASMCRSSSFSSSIAVNTSLTTSSCHCSCRSNSAGPDVAPLSTLSKVSASSSSTLSSVSPCLFCQGQQAASQLGYRQIVASQPDIDPQTRLTLIDSSFHPKISKLIGCDVVSGTTSFDRLDTPAACLLDHAYAAESIVAKPKVQPFRKSPSTNNAELQQNNEKTPPSRLALSPQTTSPAAKAPTVSLPPIPLPAHLQKSGKGSTNVFYHSDHHETASRLRLRKPSAASSSSGAFLTPDRSTETPSPSQQRSRSQQSSGSREGKKKILLQQKRRLDQRKRLQLQRRKEQQRRQHQKAKRLSLSAQTSRRSSIQQQQAQRSAVPPSNISLSASLPNATSTALGHSTSSVATSSPFLANSVGSGGFDIDNVVIPPPTPTALLAAAQALAESASIEIATPGFRRLLVEPYRPMPRSTHSVKNKHHRFSLPSQPSSNEPSPNAACPTSSLSEAATTPVDEAPSSRLQLVPVSPSPDVFLHPPPFEDTEELVYRRRHAPFEQQERARYLAMLQSTIAPRKSRDMAVAARPPSQNGRQRALSRSCDERRRSSRVSSTTCITDPECKPFVFPLSEAEWRLICTEKEAFAQLKHE